MKLNWFCCCVFIFSTCFSPFSLCFHLFHVAFILPYINFTHSNYHFSTTTRLYKPCMRSILFFVSLPPSGDQFEVEPGPEKLLSQAKTCYSAYWRLVNDTCTSSQSYINDVAVLTVVSPATIAILSPHNCCYCSWQI